MAASAWDVEFERVVRGYLGLLPASSELTPDADLRGLGLDSLASVQLLVTLEETYDIAVPDDLLNHSTFASPLSLWRVVDALRETALARFGERCCPRA
jgi:acyl carrier protein